jgi:hypothetical protein
MIDFYIVAVCHTIRDHKYITFWRPDDRGYTPVLNRAGKYDRERVVSHLDYYNGGDHVAIRAESIDALAVPIPDGYFDYQGVGVPNTRENWQAIQAAIVWPTGWPIKPEWYGKRIRRAA